MGSMSLTIAVITAMTNDELKEALMDRCPVLLSVGNSEIEYSRVSAVIYRIIDGKLCVSAELMDKNGRSVTIARAQNIKSKKE